MKIYLQLLVILLILFLSSLNQLFAQRVFAANTLQPITPTQFCLGSCPTMIPGPSSAISLSPSSSPSTPPSQTTTAPTTNPCATSTSSVSIKAIKVHTKATNGRISNFISLLLRFFIQLLNILRILLGGGTTPVTPPSIAPTIQPTNGIMPTVNIPPSQAQPSINPCPTASPSTIPSTAVTQTVGFPTSGIPTLTQQITPTTTVTAPVVTGSRPNSLVQASNSKTNCIYVGSYPWEPKFTAAEQATGITYNCIETFTNADPAWSDWDTPWILGSQYGYTAWIQAAPTIRTMIMTQDLIPDSVSNINNPLPWETACDQGQYNSYAKTYAQNLINGGFGYSVIRLGDEMNGNWEKDFMGTTTAEQQAWGKCFAQEVTAMRSVPGAHFLFDWNPNACVENFPLANWYPGDSYVDIIGVDLYDAFCNGSKPTQSVATFQQLAAEPDSLNAVQLFASQHGKPMSIPEWGTQFSSSGGLGDDPYYVKGIGSFVANNTMAFQSYFDPDNDGIIPLSSAYPQTLQAYIQEFKH